MTTHHRPRLHPHLLARTTGQAVALAAAQFAGGGRMSWHTGPLLAFDLETTGRQKAKAGASQAEIEAVRCDRGWPTRSTP